MTSPELFKTKHDIVIIEHLKFETTRGNIKNIFIGNYW